MSTKQSPLTVFGTASFGTGTSQAKFSSPDLASPILSLLRSRGVTELDTARAYPVGSPGTSEALLGSLAVSTWATLSTKVTSWAPGSHGAENIAKSVAASLKALGLEGEGKVLGTEEGPTGKVDIMYLHSPDRATPFEETCRAMDQEYRRGRFERFGLSNYRADEVEEIVRICEEHGWVQPTVYQGRYNAIIRSGEELLFPVLRRHGIGFYAYSPTAAGLFSGKVNHDSVNVAGSRWDLNTGLGLAYKETYLKPALLAAANEVASAAQKADVDGHAVALRWIVYHSILDGAKGDAVVLGASSVEQLEKNLNSIEDGPLDEALVKLVDRVFESVRGEAADYCL